MKLAPIMGTLKFNDGVEINTGGPLRVLELKDGVYVVGQGRLIPVPSSQEGREVIKKLKEDAKKGKKRL